MVFIFLSMPNGLLKIGIVPKDFHQEMMDSSPIIKVETAWNLTGSPIKIDDTSPYNVGYITWAQAALQDWCSGNGTLTDPYIIENVTINALSVSSGIEIWDSTAYFIIRNCTLYNSGWYLGDPWWMAGIKLYNTENGRILANNLSFNSQYGLFLGNDCNNNTVANNTMKNNYYGGLYMSGTDDCNSNKILDNNLTSNNDYGIYATNCHYNLFSGNNASDNILSGIRIDMCYYNNISNNIVNDNDQRGIQLYSGSKFNNIVGNIAYRNLYSGIHIGINSDNNTLSGNIANNGRDINARGIQIEEASNTTIFNNTANYNPTHGINTMYSQYNTIKYNMVKGNTNAGIDLYYSNRCRISENTARNNGFGIDLELQDYYNLVYNNTLIGGLNGYDSSGKNYWNNSVIGNFYSSNTNNKDANDDGLGDNPYTVIPNGRDYKPIYWDAPVLSVISPTINQLIGNISPTFQISVDEGIANTTWYVLSVSTIFFEGLSGTINQTIWNQLPNGSITISFYANDSRGFIGSKSVIVQRDIYARKPLIFTPISGQICKVPPNFVVWVDRTDMSCMWYTLNLSTAKYYFTSNGSIEESAWNSLNNGALTIRFYVNYTGSYEYFAAITIIKESVGTGPNIMDQIIIIVCIIVLATVAIAGISYYFKKQRKIIPVPQKNLTWVSEGLGYSAELEQKLLDIRENPQKFAQINDLDLSSLFKKSFTALSEKAISFIEQLPVSAPEKIEILQALLLFPTDQHEALLLELIENHTKESDF